MSGHHRASTPRPPLHAASGAGCGRTTRGVTRGWAPARGRRGGYQKREGRPRDDEVLVSRLVDRPLRPMFKKGWANETQVLQWVLSYDDQTLPEPLAITAASAALLISGAHAGHGAVRRGATTPRARPPPPVHLCAPPADLSHSATRTALLAQQRCVCLGEGRRVVGDGGHACLC